MSGVTINQLPKFIIGKILSYTDARTVCTFGSTCKKFYKLSQDDFIWKNLYPSHFDQLDDPLLELQEKSFKAIFINGSNTMRLITQGEPKLKIFPLENQGWSNRSISHINSSGRRIFYTVTGKMGTSVKSYDITNLNQISEIATFKDDQIKTPIRCLAVFDKTLFIGCGKESLVKTWDISTSKCTGAFKCAHLTSSRSVQANGYYFASKTFDGVEVYDCNGLKKTLQLSIMPFCTSFQLFEKNICIFTNRYVAFFNLEEMFKKR